MTRCCCSWPLLLLPVVQGASRTPTTTAWGAMAEVFSDDLNLKIGDLLSRPLCTATPTPCAPVDAYAPDPGAHPHVSARAHWRLRARYTRARVVASDLLSRNLFPATRPPCARSLMLRRPIQAHKSKFSRAPVHACDRYTHAPVVACARSCSRLRRLTRANAAPCAPPTPEHPPLRNLTQSPPVYFRNPKLSRSINTLNPPPPPI
jgi:hypothetical protein